MKWKLALPLVFCLLLASCGQEDPADADYEVLISTTPVAQVEGEALSPDGRFEVRGVGKSGQYISGVQPPEFLQIVDRETEEVLWQDHGWLSQSVRWSPDGAYAALACSARTWVEIKIIETGTWTAWDFTLPDGESIPEYTFLPEDWGVWQSENNLNLTVGRGGDSGEPHTYSCFVETENGAISGRSWEFTTELLPGTYDFNHDGKPETLELTTVWFPGLTEAAVDTYVLSLLDETGETIWQDFAGTSHAEENSLYACQTGGADYFLRYHPYTQQGICTYYYELFSLDENGEEVVLQESGVEFSADGSMYETVGFDAAEIEAFLQEVHGYLDAGTLLVSTVPGDELFFLDNENGLTRMENLQKHKEELEAIEAY